MKNKVLLITSTFENPIAISKVNNNIGEEKFGYEEVEKQHYAIGLAYIHSYIESKGYCVEGLYLNSYPFEECLERIKNKLEYFSPDFVGIQIFSVNRISSYKIIEYIRENYPKIKIIVGGLHATLMYHQILEKYPFLTIVIGEGELTFVELLNSFKEGKKNMRNIKGIAYKIKGKVIVTDSRPLIENLDELPYPKHEVFFRENRSQACLLTTRGCPFKCSFCCMNPLTKRRVRFRSVKNVVDEIEYLAKSFKKIKLIWIHDETFTLDNNRVIQICDEIIKRGIKKEFIASGRIKPISKKMIKKMEEANFKYLILGVESGCDDILKKAHKGITKKDIVETFKLFKNSKVILKIFIIIGLPGETKETIIETSKFVRDLQKIIYISLGDTANYLRIYPGAEVYEIAKEAGIISDKYWLTELSSPIFTLENSLETLNEFGEIFINYTAWSRMFRLKGFIHQWMMIPYFLKYLLTTKRKLLLQKIFFFIKLNKEGISPPNPEGMGIRNGRII